MAWTVRYVRADAAGGGDGTTNTNSGANGAWTLAEGITNEAAGMQLNMLAGTYANTTTNRTFAAAGTTTQPVWWRGFKSTIGDMDTMPTTARVVGTDIPSVTFTSGVASISGAYHIMSSMSFLATTATTATLAVSGADVKLHRVRAENQKTASVNASALSSSAATRIRGEQCWFKATTGATACLNVAGGTGEWDHCSWEGGIAGVAITSGSNAFRNCNFINPLTNCVTIAGGATLSFISCTFYNPSTDALRNNTTIAVSMAVVNCLFHTIPGVAINNNTGTNTNNINVNCPVYYTVGTTTTGLGDTPVWDAITESSDPCVNVAGLDFTIKPTALCYQKGATQLFEGELMFDYSTPGATDPVSSSPRNVAIRTGGRM